MQRRDFLAAAGGAPLMAYEGAPVKLGVDLFSLRTQGWSPFEYLDYCAKWGARVVHFSEIRFLGGLEDGHVREVGDHAKKLGIEVEIGMRSVCPTSKLFDANAGTAEEQLTRMIRAATIANSKIVRCVLGSMEDRKTRPIEQHIEATAHVLRNVKSRVVDAGLKIAIENHAGDMQGRELLSLIQQAGPDFVGACLDSGNPLWTLEDPHLTLETLASYVLTSHIRDSYLWDTPQGTAVRWVRMGDGNVDIAGYVKRYVQKCPGRALSLEIIVTGPRVFAWKTPEFWDGYRTVPAWEFSRFLALAAAGKPQPPMPPVPREQAAELERADFEASMRRTKEMLGLA